MDIAGLFYKKLDGNKPTNVEQMEWVSVADHMPIRSIDNDDHSMVVLVCEGIDGPRKPYSPYTAHRVMAAYYDFKESIWKNDLYGDRITWRGAPGLQATHWQRLQPDSSAAWQPAAIKPPNMDEYESVPVLVCNKGDHYEDSVMMANYAYIGSKEGYWNILLDLDEPAGKPGKGKADVSHWMLLPAGPVA
jgi:hypothetical protein